jgi:predicted PurR-regulated permease PerM
MGNSAESSLPWLYPQLNHDPTLGNFVANCAYAYVAVDGNYVLAYNSSVWSQLGWGYINTTAISTGDTTTAVSGPQLITQHLETSWMDLFGNTISVPTDFVLKMQGTDSTITQSTIDIEIETVLQAAYQALQSQTASALSTTDSSLTVSGALVNLIFTLFTLIASYTGRKELRDLLQRCVPKAAAYTLTALSTWFIVVTPPILTLLSEQATKAQNDNGTETTGVWATGSIASAAEFRVVGMVTMRFAAVYSTAATVLVWCNVLLALVGVTVMTVLMLYQYRKASSRSRDAVAASQHPRDTRSNKDIAFLN